jgi:hypothetical protein
MDSPQLTELLAKARAASVAERELWSKVRGKHPGQPDHDPKAWGEWLAAADLVRHLAEELRRLEP